MIDGLRLDYPNGFVGESSVGVIEFPMPDNAAADIPFGTGFGGSIDDAYPFVGNGFAASRQGRLTPEYRMDALPPEGAKMYRVDQQGSKTLVAEVVNGLWEAR